MNKVLIIPEEHAIQLLQTLNEFKDHCQQQIVGVIGPQVKTNHLTEKQAASILKCSISKIQLLRKNNIIPYWRCGRSIRYNEEDVLQFIKDNSFTHNGMGGKK